MKKRSMVMALLLIACWTGGVLSCYARCLRAAGQPEEAAPSCCGHARESKPLPATPCGGENDDCPLCIGATYGSAAPPVVPPSAPVRSPPPGLGHPLPHAAEISIADLPVHRDLWPPGSPPVVPERSLGRQARAQGPPFA